jgi:uncharacterized cupin superfamily protein
MKPIILKSPDSSAFSAFVAVPEPLGETVTQTRSVRAALPETANADMGLWEATPGSWHRQIAKQEFAYFLAGHCFFTPSGGEPIEIREGDSVYFPENTFGVWDIRETVKKAYFTPR